jgi:N utilization substance protein B
VGELGTQRHQARERALEILYEATIKDRPVAQIIQGLALAPDPYTVAIVFASEQNRSRAEQLIERNLQDWTLERLALIDRLILTMAIGELLLEEPPPTAVVLDEAVELAKVYSTDGSASFVNGVLSACVDDLG